MINRIFLFVGILSICNILEARNAPVISVPSLYGCSTGNITIPATVTGFSSIGAISLSLEYDPAILTFIHGTANPLVPGSLLIGDNPLPNGKRQLIMGWFGSSFSLPDGSSLVDLAFYFNGGTTTLTWLDDGGSCEYTDAELESLNDFPTPCYYYNGLVSSAKSLSINLLLEGLYNNSTHHLVSAIGDEISPCVATNADYVRIELHNAINYSIIEYTTPEIYLTTEGMAGVIIPAAFAGNYFIVVRHRNSIKTVSALPVSFAGNMISYNFTDASSKAFGNNMIQLADGRWAFYSGDATQDGVVDIGDMSLVDNDAAIFANGYLPTDLNGDGSVDIGDMTIIDNNAAAFVSSVNP